MKVYVVEYNNGEDWEDNADYIVGIYSSMEKAEKVAEEVENYYSVAHGLKGWPIITERDLDTGPFLEYF